MFRRQLLSVTFLFAAFSVIFPSISQPQVAQPQAIVSAKFAKELGVIEEWAETRRAELGIPGMALVIVKDGEIIYEKGLGFKDFEKKIPVTPDTQFAIGSATKAFTALTVLMEADEGKINLDLSPKRYLPYFKINDSDTDKAITVRDLMDHSSGLNRTDLAMLTGKLTRPEIIKVVGEAKPMAKLHEKFFYNNIMFAAAGEIVSTVAKMPWEKFVDGRIFAPLGMTNSDISISEMKKSHDYSFGYEFNFDTKETRRVPFRPINDVSPAGAINSSVADMAKWIKFVMNGGVENGKRLISEKNYEEWLKPQFKITPNGKMTYGFGWFLQDWNGLKVVQHGGNIDGFNSMVAMIPEKKLGFVLLTNVSASPIGGDLMPVIWSNILGFPSSDELQKEVGKYHFAEVGHDIDIELKDGRLIAQIPTQPILTLEKIGNRKFRVREMENSFVTFTNNSLLFENPQGVFTLAKIKEAQKKLADDSAKTLIGKYRMKDVNAEIEIKAEADTKVTFNIKGQQPYALEEKSADIFAMDPLPESYSLKAKRNSENNVTSVVVRQPEGEFEFFKINARANQQLIAPDDLISKVIAATGGEANLRKSTSRIVASTFDAIHQGVKGFTTSWTKAPNKMASRTTFTALGKTIGSGWEFFDGSNGGEVYTFFQYEAFGGQKLEDIRLNADFYGVLDWKKNYQKIEVTGSEKVGDEDCFVVEFTPEKGSKATEYYSKNTFLLLKRVGIAPSAKGGAVCHIPLYFQTIDWLTA